MKNKYSFFIVSQIFISLCISLAAHSKAKIQGNNSEIKQKPHDSNFMNKCVESFPTVYNPSIEDKMQGGKKNRHSGSNGKSLELVNSVEDAASNGFPVSVAMDIRGDFGAKCNWKNQNGTQRKSCLMLVQLPGLDDPAKGYPSYRKKFPNLPKDSFLALVEDTGGAFFNKGTGKIDIPFRTQNKHIGNGFNAVKFEVLSDTKYKPEDAKNFRKHQFTSYKPFDVGGRSAKCNWDTSNAGNARGNNKQSSRSAFIAGDS